MPVFRRAQNPQISAQISGGKINNICCLNDNLLLLEWNLMPLLVLDADFFFPKKLAGAGISHFFCCLFSWIVENLGAGAPGIQVHLFNYGISMVLEFKLGNVDLIRAWWS